MNEANETRPSLLIRIRDQKDKTAWAEFFDLYSPLLYGYARDRGLSHEDAEDIRASCYETIVKKIGEFDYEDKKTGFRAWLRTMVNRRVIDHFRKKQSPTAESSDLKNLQSQQQSLEELWEKNWRLHHLRYCIATVGKRVQPESFEVFKMLTESELSAQEAAEQAQMNVDQVYKIKSRMLKMISAEMKNFDLD